MTSSSSEFHNFDIEEDSLFEEVNHRQIEVISVSQALRQNFGNVKVKGTIIGISKLFKMISKIEFYCDNCKKIVEIDYLPPVFDIADIDKRCNQCNMFKINKNDKNKLNPIFKNAVIIELQDTETFNDMDRLPIFLFDNDTDGIMVGETITVTGDIEVINNKNRYFTYLYGESIKYLNREDFSLTKLDIEAIKRFRNKKGKEKVIDELVSLFDHSIVGYAHVKKGILCSAVNTSSHILKSEHLDALFIGDPGLAKTKLLKRATELIPGSSMESAQNSSGKSITAIIEKADDNTFLRLGAIPRARGAICGLNEIARMSQEDQAHLLDIMQEREFTINKHGINAKIKAPTTIIGSANPVNRSTWIDNDKVDLNEFSILEPIVDRFDLKFVFKKRKSKEEIDEFVDKLSEVEDKKDRGRIPQYISFLIKYLQYAKQFNPILTEEARTMLKEFYKKISIQDFGSPRILITLFKLAKAIARLKLKEIADETDAKEAMEFYNVMLVDFKKSVVISQSPRDLAYNECVSILKELKNFVGSGIVLEELFKKACENNQQISDYLAGRNSKKSLRIDKNHKTRAVYDMLLNNQNIVKIGENPIVLRWRLSSQSTSASSSPPPLSTSSTSNIDGKVGEGSVANIYILPDTPDVPDIQISNNEKKYDDMINKNNTKKLMSDTSDTSDRKEEEEESITNDDDDEVKLLNISGKKKGQPIKMSTEQYDSWMGGKK